MAAEDRHPELGEVRALGLVSSRRNLLTWAANENGEVRGPNEPQTARGRSRTEPLGLRGKLLPDSDDESEADHEAAASVPDPSDPEDPEEMDFLALDLVQVLPMEKVTALLDNLRHQDVMMQELLKKNYALSKDNKRLRQHRSKQGDEDPDAHKRVPKYRTSGAKNPEGRLLERLEVALRTKDEIPDQDKQRANGEQTANAGESSASTEDTPRSPQERDMIESLQAKVKQLTETNEQLQEQVELLAGKVQRRDKALDQAEEEIKRLKAPRTYNLRLTPARYRDNSAERAKKAAESAAVDNSGEKASALQPDLDWVSSSQNSQSMSSPRKSIRDSLTLKGQLVDGGVSLKDIGVGGRSKPDENAH